MFIRRGGLLALVALVIFSIIGADFVTAQIPDEFTNLKVLPEDISKRELVSVMRQFAGALGKRCNYCHVGESAASLEGYDFASDEKETKQIARIMMKMTSDINNTHMPKLERDEVIRVRCVTCHHGVDEPETIDNVVLTAIDKDGIESGIATYRELREEYYGKAAYNFSAGPLNSVGETLAQEREDLAGAITIMKMNVEYHPEAAYSHLLLGQFYAAAGDKAAAIASVEKCIELQPDNNWAKGILEKIKAE